jgi:hypothetical protein
MNSSFKIKKVLSGIAFILIAFSSQAQMNINSSFSLFGEIGVFGNLQLSADAQVFFQNSSTLHMLGTTTTVSPNAEIFANTATTQAGTGRLLFVGNAPQTLDGGNSSVIGGDQPSLINLAINNPDNLTLTNTNTRITSGLDFIDGHVILGNNGLELSSAATSTNANGTRHVVTNGTGFMAKEDFSTAFSFPVGIATSDYTPATIDPTTSADDFFVQVKEYNESASDEVTSADGIDRTWNIYSTSGVGALIALQHNSGSNGGSYISNGGDASAFVTQYQGIQYVPYVGSQGTWQVGTGAQGTQVVNGTTVIHNRTYTSTSTSSSANGAFFSKSTNILTPLPITLLDFKATKRNETQALLSWSTTSEYNSSHFEVETSTNGQTWRKIGEVKAQGVSSDLSNYQLLHNNPAIGINFYRLNLIDLSGHSDYSQIRTLEYGSNQTLANHLLVYPNPSMGVLNVLASNIENTYTLINMEGKILNIFTHTNGLANIQIDMSGLANGVYQLKANSQNGEVKVFKIVLNK